MAPKAHAKRGVATLVAVIVALITGLAVLYAVNAPSLAGRIRAAVEGFHEEPVVEFVFVHSRGCPHCVAFEPEFDEWLAKRRSRDAAKGSKRAIRVTKLEASSERARISELNVQGYPTVICMVKGSETGRRVGRVSTDVLDAMLGDA